MATASFVESRRLLLSRLFTVRKPPATSASTNACARSKQFTAKARSAARQARDILFRCGNSKSNLFSFVSVALFMVTSPPFGAPVRTAYDGREPRQTGARLGRARFDPADRRFLEDIFRVGARTEHPIGDAEQTGPVPGENLSRCIHLLHSVGLILCALKTDQRASL
jgi:hypothetical protein